MREVRALAGEPGALRRDRDAVRQPHGILASTCFHSVARDFQAALHLEDGPHECRRVTAVKHDGIKSIETKMFEEPGHAAFLGHRRALIDPPPIVDHDRHDEPGIFGPPPAGRPVAAALLFECAVRKECNQSLTGERHMDIFQFGEAQIPAFKKPTGSVRVDVTAQR